MNHINIYGKVLPIKLNNYYYNLYVYIVLNIFYLFLQLNIKYTTGKISLKIIVFS